ncbi:hypothetical protein K438DRAFT_1846085 [Mycena galopus ATCC 62051]|nr:hypothetical protein K438DRAFT_1846085 [Mycena galopus ATCC 62051]
MYLPSASASNANGEYTGGGSGNAPRALPVPPGVSANNIAARNTAAAGSYSAYAASGACQSTPAPPRSSLRTLTPRALPRRMHGLPRAMSADGGGGAEADGVKVLAPSSSMSLYSSSSVSDDEPRRHGNHLPFRRVGSTLDARPPRVVLYGRHRRECRPSRPTRPQERRDALASTAPRCIAVRPLELKRILLLQRCVVALRTNIQAVTVRFPI